ncbi:transcriptional regulator [Georgenia faecalis]|uniref:Transcriptional regulator n=1 Tax=Georgenia faecalis TaxID=2483799 RepID=A0ABV9DCE9_9MICO|nr:transcriptional regulator [Georgenia faecalis]
MSSPLDGLDPILNQPKRLAAIAMVAASTSCDFPFLRDQLELSDSDLSRHMTALSQAGYVTIRKSGGGRGSTTTYAITKTGRAAYGRHRDTLTAFLAAHDPGTSSP